MREENVWQTQYDAIFQKRENDLLKGIEDKVQYAWKEFDKQEEKYRRQEEKQKKKADKELKKVLDMADKRPLHRKGSLNRGFDS